MSDIFDVLAEPKKDIFDIVAEEKRAAPIIRFPTD